MLKCRIMQNFNGKWTHLVGWKLQLQIRENILNLHMVTRQVGKIASPGKRTVNEHLVKMCARLTNG